MWYSKPRIEVTIDNLYQKVTNAIIQAGTAVSKIDNRKKGNKK